MTDPNARGSRRARARTNGGLQGALARRRKRAWLRRANALLAPSLRGESFGLTLLEGMASETTVVASDITGYREAAGEHAMLFGRATRRTSNARRPGIRTESAQRIGVRASTPNTGR